jgi:hypothetical protein
VQVTVQDVGAERLDVNDEHEESYKLAVANGDPKLMAWDVLADEREAAENEMQRRHGRERRQGLSVENHAQERRDLAESFNRQYSNVCALINAGGKAADAAIADMRARRDGIPKVTIFDAFCARKRAEDRRAKIERRNERTKTTQAQLRAAQEQLQSVKACTRGCDTGLLNPIKMRSDFLVKASSFVCECHGACSALEKPHADPCLQPPDRPTDAR